MIILDIFAGSRFILGEYLSEVLQPLTWWQEEALIQKSCPVIRGTFKLTCWYENRAYQNVIPKRFRAYNTCMLLEITWGLWSWNINMSCPILIAPAQQLHTALFISFYSSIDSYYLLAYVHNSGDCASKVEVSHILCTSCRLKEHVAVFIP